MDIADMDQEVKEVVRIDRPDRLLSTTIKVAHTPFILHDEESGIVGLFSRNPIDGHLGAVED